LFNWSFKEANRLCDCVGLELKGLNPSLRRLLGRNSLFDLGEMGQEKEDTETDTDTDTDT